MTHILTIFLGTLHNTQHLATSMLLAPPLNIWMPRANSWKHANSVILACFLRIFLTRAPGSIRPTCAQTLLVWPGLPNGSLKAWRVVHCFDLSNLLQVWEESSPPRLNRDAAVVLKVQPKAVMQVWSQSGSQLRREDSIRAIPDCLGIDQPIEIYWQNQIQCPRMSKVHVKDILQISFSIQGNPWAGKKSEWREAKQ